MEISPGHGMVVSVKNRLAAREGVWQFRRLMLDIRLIPEPTAGALLATAGLIFLRRRRP